MGKFLLLAVLGSSLVLAQQLYSSQQTESETNLDQKAYQEEVIAREIATSAFNYGMAEVRSHQENVQDAAVALNGPSGQGRQRVHTSGKFAGGRHTVRAKMTSGHSIQVISSGEYGAYVDENGVTQYRASFEMHDETRVPVLTVRRKGVLDVKFLKSLAGNCSAVFYQAYEPGMPEGTVPEVKMLFASNNISPEADRPTQQIRVEAGTLMNFFIGVDPNCSQRVEDTMTSCEVREYIEDYTYTPSHFTHTHEALTIPDGDPDQASEGLFAFVEQAPDDRNRWRIAWEDVHDVNWDQPASDDPRLSLQATKAYGYDPATGWAVDASGDYRELENLSGRPDFSDQVIEVVVHPVGSAGYSAAMSKESNAKSSCGEGPSTEDPSTEDPSTEDPSTEDPATEDPATEDPSTEEPSTEDPSDPEYESENDGADCTCQGVKKMYVYHRPPGNEHNPQKICIGAPAWYNAHSQNHNDHLICTGLDKK